MKNKAYEECHRDIVAIWRELEPAIRPGRLTRLALWETPNNYVEYSGE